MSVKPPGSPGSAAGLPMVLCDMLRCAQGAPESYADARTRRERQTDTDTEGDVPLHLHRGGKPREVLARIACTMMNHLEGWSAGPRILQVLILKPRCINHAVRLYETNKVERGLADRQARAAALGGSTRLHHRCYLMTGPWKPMSLRRQLFSQLVLRESIRRGLLGFVGPVHGR